MYSGFSERKETDMSKLDHALYEIHHMDTIAERDQWVNHIHPLVKLLVTICFILITVSFSKYDLTELLRMFCRWSAWQVF